jgi:hypothetical protein
VSRWAKHCPDAWEVAGLLRKFKKNVHRTYQNWVDRGQRNWFGRLVSITP